MREIKFRGKRKDNGKWTYGDLIQLLGEQGGGRKFIVDNRFGACIDENGDFVNTEAPFVNEVDPETVGQDTGLKDKNDREIFDGDILHWNIGFDMYSAVEYQNGSFWSGETLLADSLEEVVVGNIYDNADLIAEV